MNKSDFIFTAVRDNRAELGKFYYHFDEKTGKILFKSRYKFEKFEQCYLKFEIGKMVYITDKNGVTLLKLGLDKFNSLIKECDTLEKWHNETKLKHQKEKAKLIKKFQGKGYDNVFEVRFKDKTFYIVKKDGLYGVINEKDKVIIDFKYPSFHTAVNFEKSKNFGFIVQDAITKKYGMIDLQEKPIIPFMYDDIHIWNIDEEEETMVVVKNGKCGVIDVHNNILVDFKFDYIYSYLKFMGDYTFCCNKKGLWGIMDRKGNVMNVDLTNVKEVNATTLRRKNAISERQKAGYFISTALLQLWKKLSTKKYIAAVVIKDFKNTKDKKIVFKYGVNIILGDNGSGKTHIINEILNGLNGNGQSIVYEINKKTTAHNFDIINPKSAEEVEQLMNKNEPFKDNSVVIIDNLQAKFDTVKYDKFLDFLKANRYNCQFIITSTRSFSKLEIGKLNATIYVV